MRIATWNVNSIRQRLDHVVGYLKDYAPDVLCLQELKCLDDAFPRLEVEAVGYQDIETRKPEQNIWWKLLREAENQLASWTAAAAKAGVEEREVSLREDQALKISGAINQILTALDLRACERFTGIPLRPIYTDAGTNADVDMDVDIDIVCLNIKCGC